LSSQKVAQNRELLNGRLQLTPEFPAKTYQAK
jgi:hypothetical protein